MLIFNMSNLSYKNLHSLVSQSASYKTFVYESKSHKNTQSGDLCTSKSLYKYLHAALHCGKSFFFLILKKFVRIYFFKSVINKHTDLCEEKKLKFSMRLFTFYVNIKNDGMSLLIMKNIRYKSNMRRRK